MCRSCGLLLESCRASQLCVQKSYCRFRVTGLEQNPTFVQGIFCRHLQLLHTVVCSFCPRSLQSLPQNFVDLPQMTVATACKWLVINIQSSAALHSDPRVHCIMLELTHSTGFSQGFGYVTPPRGRFLRVKKQGVCVCVCVSCNIT